MCYQHDKGIQLPVQSSLTPSPAAAQRGLGSRVVVYKYRKLYLYTGHMKLLSSPWDRWALRFQFSTLFPRNSAVGWVASGLKSSCLCRVHHQLYPVQLSFYHHLFIHFKMKPDPNLHENQGAAVFAESLAGTFPICGSFFARAAISLCNRSGSLEQMLLVLTALWLMAVTA